MKPEKKIVPLCFGYYAIPLVFMVLSGLINALYLSLSHYRNYTDIGYQSFCALSKAINCDTVSQSSHSILFDIPVAVWGVVGYLFYSLILSCALRSSKKNGLWTILFLNGICFTLISLYFAGISAFIIKSYCILCILSYGINMLLTFYPWLIFKRFCSDGFFTTFKADLLFIKQTKQLCNALIIFLICISFILFFFPRYWVYSFPKPEKSIATGLTEDHSPWIGAKDDPELIIHEYSDYLCFQCKKMHQYLRKLVHTYPDKIRLVHHNYPLDHEFNPVLVDKPFHIGSGKLALISIYAASTDNFWEVNDRLYTLSQFKSAISLKTIGEKTRLDPKILSSVLTNPSVRKKLDHDIRKGLKLRITGTPSYVINGKVYEGTIPPEIIRTIQN
ncbi:MAG: thioredoxin domain-containing protein [Desulfobacterales bacterium]|nr:thioredoxin domain-containing protein [Desulfobacterales bacterium]